MAIGHLYGLTYENTVLTIFPPETSSFYELFDCSLLCHNKLVKGIVHFDELLFEGSFSRRANAQSDFLGVTSEKWNSTSEKSVFTSENIKITFLNKQR